jgi:signal transduction histidine kinase
MGLTSARIILLAPKTKEVRASVGFPVAKQSEEQNSRWPLVLDYFRNGTSELDFRNPQNGLLSTAEETQARLLLKALNPEYAFAIKRPDALFGTVILGHKRDGVPFTQDDVELGQSLANSLAITLDRIQLKDRATYLEKMELLSVMSSGLAHDLNNGLTPILTYLQMRGEQQRVSGPMDSTELEDFSIALKNAHILRANIESTLFFSRQQKPNFQKVRSLALLERALDLPIRPDRQNSKIMIKDEAQCDIECDAVMMGRVMDNLVGNAVDASDNGTSVWVVASVLPETPLRRKWIRIRITDQGSGIPPELLNKVFEPYFSTKKTGDTKRGFGLGLSIVERLIYLHGGIVTIESAVNKGTTVQFDIPAIQPDTSEHPFAASKR